MKQRTWKTYVFWIVLSEAVGALAGWLTRDGIAIFNSTVIQPPLSPPGVVFPIVWTILYALMGIGAARVSIEAEAPERNKALKTFCIQLAMNFLWPIVFFNGQAYGFAFVWLILLWIMVLRMVIRFWQVDRVAGNLQIPYLIWLTFAAYLNLGVWYLNR